MLSIGIFRSIFNSTEYLLLVDLSIIDLTIYYLPNNSNITDDEYKVRTRGMLV